MLLMVILTALAISMATTPLMMRLAPRLNMVDVPGPRKVQTAPVPRVGGIGIVAGALVSMMLWIEPQPWHGSYLLGSLVLLIFGAADDSMELGHYTKFIGQFIAAIAVVYWGDIWVAHMPFMSHDLDAAIGKPFTIFALVGVMNAINHSDGLDGLAGGESLLSLGCIAYLGYLAGGTQVVVLAAAVGGGVFGFLRFNTHPAQVFMGDAGSQFLGFSLGVLAVLLTQQVNPVLSMVLPALLVGLPIADILAVFAQRIYHRMNWFRATRNHVHHRLLDIGFAHSQSVVAIYSIQMLLVLSALVLSYESDVLVASWYVGVCASVFALITWAEQRGWRLARAVASSNPRPVATATRPAALRQLPMQFVKITVPLYVIGASLLVEHVPADFAWAAAAIVGLAILSLLMNSPPVRRLLLRCALYSGVACVVFLMQYSKGYAGGFWAEIEMAYFAVLALAVAMALRMENGPHSFRTTPLDFLLVIVVVASGFLAARQIGDDGIVAGMIVRLAVLFYACELLIHGNRPRDTSVQKWSLIGAAALLISKTLAIV